MNYGFSSVETHTCAADAELAWFDAPGEAHHGTAEIT